MRRSRIRRWIPALLLAGAVGCAPAAEPPTDVAGADPAHDHEAATPAAVTTDDGQVAEGADEAPRKSFPALDYLQQVPAAYRVANRHPEVLEAIPCYCPCELYGHGGLIDCYRSQHAAACSTCLDEALMAGQLVDETGADGPEEYARVAAQVKARARNAVVQSTVQRGEMPDLASRNGQAFLQACSDCHQPAHPAMYTAEGWRESLARMESYARQSDRTDFDPALWQQAVDYVRSTSGRFPPEAGAQYRESLRQAVERLVADEGEAVHYPGARDPVLGVEWFERMVRAYRLAQEIPAERLAAVQMNEPTCEAAGHETLLQCLNYGHGITSERAVELVEELAGQRTGD